jgi:hypothetical protein
MRKITDLICRPSEIYTSRDAVRVNFVNSPTCLILFQESELLIWIWDRVKVDRFVDTDVNILVSEQPH